MPTYFELMDSINKSRTRYGYGVEHRGLGDVSVADMKYVPGQPFPYTNASSPGSDQWHALVGDAVGSRGWLNQCRTPQNPQGWIVGTGGMSHPNPLDWTYPADTWAALQLDTQLQHANDLRNMGYGCPNTPEQIAAAIAASPFMTPVQPVGSPYGPPPATVTTPPVANLPPNTVPVNPFPDAIPPTPPPVTIPPPAPTKGGSIQFSASRGGNTFYPGDTWTISISGASYNAPVAANGNPFGSIDVYGNWYKTGTFTNGDVGPWNQNWTVAGQQIGNWVFNVLATPSTAPPAQTLPLPVNKGNMTIQFNASRSGNIFYVGDTWSVVIAGATPGAAVTADGNPFGAIDAAGNWSKAGSFSASEIGTWSEHWSVGGVVIGTWSFTVLAVSPPPTTGNTTTGSMHDNVGTVTKDGSVADLASGATALGTNAMAFLQGETFKGVPNWLLAAGGLAAMVFMMKTDKGR